MWYVYILHCQDESYYTGSTSDISRRIERHNAGKGSLHTKTRLPVKLVYSEQHQHRFQALKREAQIKAWSKQKKLALINHNLSLLQNLSKSRD